MFKYTTILVFSFLLLVHQTQGSDDDGQNVWNLFFDEEEDTQTPNECQERQMKNSSVAYTHWGRTDCTPDSSDIVYTGYVGGGLYSQHGAGTKPLCLPESPEYNTGLIASGASSGRSGVYGAEYDTSSYAPLSGMNDWDAVCAVCLARGRSTSMMIPAKRTCPEGWTKEYEGLLMGSLGGRPSGYEHLCVDANPQARPSSSSNQNGFLLSPAVGVCGSLPCPPYVGNDELACVVCTW
ncbi:short-chain collagen C4-like [Antedon mediterranea]|uniref:short-chain collagen C4-like n=1 Tax=Antedon mediterranea TaxID=105859 RepID=UPI003AF75575